MIFNSCFLTIIPFSRPNMYFFDYKMKTPSRTMRGREYHATEIILIGCLQERPIHKKVGGTRKAS